MPGKTPIDRLSNHHFRDGSRAKGESPATLPFQEHRRHEPGVKQLISDVVGLAELQVRLLNQDLQSSLCATIRPSITICLAFAATLSALAAFILGIAGAIAAQWDWPLWAAQLTTGGAVILVSGIVISVAARRLMRCADPLMRSLDQLTENLASLKKATTSSEQRDVRR